MMTRLFLTICAIGLGTTLVSCEPVDKLFTGAIPDGNPNEPLGCLLKWCPVEPGVIE